MDRSLAISLFCLTALLLVCFVAAICFGAQEIAPPDLIAAVRGKEGLAHDLIFGQRLPRAFAAIVIGASLAVAGLVMQSLARNPLADPSLTGVNAGAALFVVIGLMSFGGALPRLWVAALALTGAAVATVLVRLLAGRGDATLRLPLAGAALASICMSVVALVVLMNPEARNIYRFWMVGSLAMADAQGLLVLTPVALVGIGMALVAARGIEAMMLSDEFGAALGISPSRTLGLSLGAIAFTAGTSVALAGPVGFIGLVAPHLARRMSRGGLTVLILISAPLGASLALFADTVGRVAFRPSELPIGIVLAMIGAPAFMIFVRQTLRARA